MQRGIHLFEQVAVVSSQLVLLQPRPTTTVASEPFPSLCDLSIGPYTSTRFISVLRTRLGINGLYDRTRTFVDNLTMAYESRHWTSH
jgi:hypothetical protein